MAPTLLASRARLGRTTRGEDGDLAWVGEVGAATPMEINEQRRPQSSRLNWNLFPTRYDAKHSDAKLVPGLGGAPGWARGSNPSRVPGGGPPVFCLVLEWVVECRIASSRSPRLDDNEQWHQRTAMETGGDVRVKVADPSLSVPPGLDDHPAEFTTTGLPLPNHHKLRRIVAYIQHRKHTRPHPRPPRLIACGATRTTPTGHP